MPQTAPLEEHESQAIIGADGAASQGGSNPAGWPKQPTVPLVQAIVRLPTDYPPGTVRVWFVPDDTPYFYWLIPESATRGCAGLDRRGWSRNAASARSLP